MPKLPLSTVTNLTKVKSFWEGVRMTYGTNALAGKAMGVSPKLIAKYSETQTKPVSDKDLKTLQKGIARMSRGHYQVAKYYTEIKPVKWTRGQVEFAKQYTATGEKARRYFRKAVREAYTKNIRHIKMPALDPATGKVFNPSPAKKKVRRGSKRTNKRSNRRAIRRRRR